MEKDIYSLVYELLLSGQKIILARTIRRSGSTPRGVGSMVSMIIANHPEWC